MKKIINGKRYDTETAKLVDSWSNNFSCNDFHWYCEDLFLKKTGEFFIYGIGNGLSPYAESVGLNCSQSGEKIIPISIEEAKKWIEKKSEVDIYEDLFEVEDEFDLVLYNILPEILYKKLKKEAIKKGQSKKGVTIEALKKYLND